MLKNALLLLTAVCMISCGGGTQDESQEPVVTPAPTPEPPPDRTLVFVNSDSTNGDKMYAVSAETGEKRLLVSSSNANFEIGNFQMINGGDQVVFSAEDYGTFAGSEAFVVNIDGTGFRRLHGELTQGEIDYFAVSKDETKLYFRENLSRTSVQDLYVIDIVSGTLNPVTSLNNTADTSLFEMSSDSYKLLYSADEDTDNVYELYMVDPDGANEQKVGPITQAAGDIRRASFTPDSNYILYTADDTVDGQYNMFRVDVSTGARTQMNSTLPSGALGARSSFTISPDSQWVVFVADYDTAGVDHIYKQRIDGAPGSHIRVSSLSASLVQNPTFTPDSTKILYSANQEIPGATDLYVASVAETAPGASTRISSSLTTTYDVYDYRVSDDSSSVLYRADLTTDNLTELYYAPLSGATQIKVNADPVNGATGGIRYFGFMPGNQTVIYLGEQDRVDKDDLYSSSIGSSTGNVRLSLDSAVGNSYVTNFVQYDQARNELYFMFSDDNDRGLYKLNLESMESSKLSSGSATERFSYSFSTAKNIIGDGIN